jgi:argininosuccinate synthase
MIDYCTAHKLPIKASKDAPYSTDANLLGLTHEAGKLEHLTTSPWFVTPGMGVKPEDAPDKSESFTVRFEQGRPVAVNGKPVSVFEAIREANRIGGTHAVGICTHLVENRFVGIKSRGVYEAPGMELLGTCYAYLLQLVLDRRARELFDHLSLFVAKQIYQGYGFDLATHMAREAMRPVLKLMTGTVRVTLYKGGVTFAAAEDVPAQLYSESNASMEAIGEFDHADSEGFLRVLQVSARALAVNGQVVPPGWAGKG